MVAFTPPEEPDGMALLSQETCESLIWIRKFFIQK